MKLEYSDAVIVFSWLLSIAAFIPAHWHIWRTNPCLCRSLQCTALQSEPSPPDQSPPWERKRELKEPGVVAGRERQSEWDSEWESTWNRNKCKHTHQLTCDYNSIWSFFLIQENSSPKKRKILSSFTRFKPLWLFYFRGEQKYIFNTTKVHSHKGLSSSSKDKKAP